MGDVHVRNGIVLRNLAQEKGSWCRIGLGLTALPLSRLLTSPRRPSSLSTNLLPLLPLTLVTSSARKSVTDQSPFWRPDTKDMHFPHVYLCDQKGKSFFPISLKERSPIELSWALVKASRLLCGIFYFPLSSVAAKGKSLP